ncbi:heavy-metal-associated domain-containing protein [Anaerosphaera multitolerans]|uniref:Heavy-metal-associated domain-containing protein n=1 Tax=Anaerosphaera multitolerans TaxID=2487351 RepID=A0A437S6Q8_9FIRM|nr:heavy metal-associated domain-containing protein [Anaerosphaera multitolerans]RVU54713.1 heavy-metal-associated domain-containing protein [Anaerosphaera multitolerans]
MEKTLKIDGMTCEHCSARVKDALEALDNVESVKVSLFKNKAVVQGENLDESTLKSAVENSGYKVTSID